MELGNWAEDMKKQIADCYIISAEYMDRISNSIKFKFLSFFFFNLDCLDYIGGLSIIRKA